MTQGGWGGGKREGTVQHERGGAYANMTGGPIYPVDTASRRGRAQPMCSLYQPLIASIGNGNGAIHDGGILFAIFLTSFTVLDVVSSCHHSLTSYQPHLLPRDLWKTLLRREVVGVNYKFEPSG